MPAYETVYIGVIPGKKNLAGIPFRTDIGNMYQTKLESAKYQCEINGGKDRYFFVEERTFISYPESENRKPRLGNIKKIHHFNQNIDEKEQQETGEGNSDAFREAVNTAIDIFGWCASFAILLYGASKHRDGNESDPGDPAPDTNTKGNTNRRALPFPRRK